MEKQDQEILMKPLSTDTGEAIDVIEWVNWRASPCLVGSSRSAKFEPVLRMYPVDGQRSSGAAEAFTLPAQLSKPQWSASVASDDSLSVVLTRPGSAISPLVFWNSGSRQQVALSAQRPAGVFDSPRFVRRVQGTGAPAVALESLAASKVVVLFGPPDTGEPWNYRVLHAPEAGVVQQALAVQSDAGYLLFYKVFVPGGAEVDASGALPSLPHPLFGSVTQGIVYGIRLDRDFGVAGKAFRPLGGELLFEFDADLVGERVVILGTTASGLVLVGGRMEDDAFVRTERAEGHLPAPLSAPTALIVGSEVYLAVLEQAGSPGARILYARRP